MVKKFFTFIALGFIATLAQAQELTQGSFNSLVGKQVVNVEFNLADATFAGMPLDEFAQTKGKNRKGQTFQDELKAATTSLKLKFMEIANDKTKYFKYLSKKDAETTLFVKLVETDDAGRNNVFDFIFMNTADKSPIATIHMQAKGGHWGSFFNLMSDAIDDGTPDFIKFVNKSLKAIAKGKK